MSGISSWENNHRPRTCLSPGAIRDDITTRCEMITTVCRYEPPPITARRHKAG